MRDLLTAGQRWRCDECLILLSFQDIWQAPDTGKPYCVDCWSDKQVWGTQPLLPPRICEECLAFIPPRAADPDWRGASSLAVVCENCASPLTADEESHALSLFLDLMKATDEEE